jgi:hypothetical protein
VGWDEETEKLVKAQQKSYRAVNINSIQFFIIYVPSQTVQGQLQT